MKSISSTSVDAPEHMKAKREHRCLDAPLHRNSLKRRKNCPTAKANSFSRRKAWQTVSNMVFHALFGRMAKTGITPHGFRSSFLIARGKAKPFAANH